VYAWSEHFVLPLSHDEVVHGKGSLLTKMPGDRWQQLANLRLLLGLQYAQPGRKLLFMGTELAPEHEWNHEGTLDWSLADRPAHAGVAAWLRDLNTTYRVCGPLHERDEDPAAFRWVEHDAAAVSVFTFLRWGTGPEPVLVAVNATPVVRYAHRIGVPTRGRWTELLNSDAEIYGGSGVGNLGGVDATDVPAHGFDHSVLVALPPLAVVLLTPAGVGPAEADTP
jgi:1,4-alpha-glucan branching enzyme